jgi:Zn-finger nucleic acid-binding protein
MTTDPRRDQEAAELRDWRERNGPPGGSVFLDRGEVERLIERGASADEIRAWLQAQIDRHVAETDAIRGLEHE